MTQKERESGAERGKTRVALQRIRDDFYANSEQRLEAIRRIEILDGEWDPSALMGALCYVIENYVEPTPDAMKVIDVVLSNVRRELFTKASASPDEYKGYWLKVKKRHKPSE